MSDKRTKKYREKFDHAKKLHSMNFTPSQISKILNLSSGTVSGYLKSSSYDEHRLREAERLAKYNKPASEPKALDTLKAEDGSQELVIKKLNRIIDILELIEANTNNILEDALEAK